MGWGGVGTHRLLSFMIFFSFEAPVEESPSFFPYFSFFLFWLLEKTLSFSLQQESCTAPPLAIELWRTAGLISFQPIAFSHARPTVCLLLHPFFLSPFFCSLSFISCAAQASPCHIMGVIFFKHYGCGPE